MHILNILNEGKNHPIIVVDVQPTYCNNNVCEKIIQFVAQQTGPVLMFVNAEQDGLTEDTIDTMKQYWEETLCDPEDMYDPETDEYNECDAIDWSRFQIVDKGYGYLRPWMDEGEDPSTIIKTIRAMYQQKVNDSRQLFNGEDSPNYEEQMNNLLGNNNGAFKDDPISVEWTSIKQLKQFNGAYIVGGSRDECLREVELLMNAFNIKYKRIDSLVYE